MSYSSNDLLLRFKLESTSEESPFVNILLTDSHAALANVFWLGGSPCAGKSSLSLLLAECFQLDVYHVDEVFETHVRRFDAVLQPALTKWCAASWEQRWRQPVDSLLREVIACYGEHFRLVLADIRARAHSRPLLVEGSALLPGLVARVLPARHHAVWLVPSADFQQTHYAQRAWVGEILAQCAEPDAAFRNWMERDARFARWVAAEVEARGLELLEVDGTRTIAELAAIVAAHFQLAGS